MDIFASTRFLKLRTLNLQAYTDANRIRFIITFTITPWSCLFYNNNHNNNAGLFKSVAYFKCSPPVDGEWETWQAWSSCNVTCGGGTSIRTRVCHAPLHGGENCTGNAEERMDCNTHDCPGMLSVMPAPLFDRCVVATVF